MMMIEEYKIPDMGFMIFKEDYLAEINPLIDKAADFIGLKDNDPERPMKSIACIEVALNHAETIRMELNEARAERDGFRNGQEQLQAICDGLQDVIKKYADERKELIAENARLKTELAAATFNLLPF